MLLEGRFRLVGVEERHGFKDTTKVYYIAGLSQGLDMLRLYLDESQYHDLLKIEPYSEVQVELDYNPVAEKNAMRLVSII